ncbi:MAG: prepilin-type N-terminal cleavage/methylation domain-containing protein [Minisyncoccia bacterium]
MAGRWRSHGFSLVEMVIYIALLTLLLLALLSAVELMLRSWGDVQSRTALMQSGASSMEDMVRAIRNAGSINSGGSIFSASPGSLELNTTISGSPTTQTFSVSGGMLEEVQGSDLAEALLQSGVSVESLTFYEITTPNSQAVRIVLQLQGASTGASPLSATFYDTAVLRGSY